MATLVKTSSGTWKAVIRKPAGRQRLKHDTEDWTRRTEDEIVRGVYIKRSSSERLTIEEALKRYPAEISPTKRPATAACDARHSKSIIKVLGKYSLASLTPESIAKYRDDWLARLGFCGARDNPAPKPRSPIPCALAWPCSVTSTTLRLKNGISAWQLPIPEYS